MHSCETQRSQNGLRQVFCTADNHTLVAPPPPTLPPFPPDTAPLPPPPSTPPPAICHANCPQSLSTVTPLSEPSRLLSNTVENTSLNDCDLTPGWYYFPGTRMAIRDFDGTPPPSRCGAQTGMVSMSTSAIPIRGEDKKRIEFCARTAHAPSTPGQS